MSNTREISIDPALEEHLQKEAPKLGNTTIQVEDEDIIPEEEKAAECTRDQRQQIFGLLHSQGYLNNDPSRMASVIKTIKTMNTEEADVYAEGLQCNNSLSFSKELTKKILKILNIYLLKEDIETAKQIEADNLLIDELNINLTTVVNKFGRYKALLMYGAYIFTGYMIMKNTNQIVYEQAEQKGNNVNPSIQIDGSSKITNG